MMFIWRLVIGIEESKGRSSPNKPKEAVRNRMNPAEHRKMQNKSGIFHWGWQKIISRQK